MLGNCQNYGKYNNQHECELKDKKIKVKHLWFPHWYSLSKQGGLLFCIGLQCKEPNVLWASLQKGERSWNWEAATSHQDWGWPKRLQHWLHRWNLVTRWPQDFQAQDHTSFTKKMRLLFLQLKIFPRTDSISYRCFTVICLLTGIRLYWSFSAKLQLTSKGLQFFIKNGSI